MQHEVRARTLAVSRFGPLLFISAFLLFGVQPLMGEWALPLFGGGPAIWTTCLLFFQAALLAGYGYAHLLASRASIPTQAKVHASVVIVVALFAWVMALAGPGPLVPSAGWRNVADPTFGVLGVLATTVGPVFLVLSASAPLFQTWFSAAFPSAPAWRLYALSNAGSLTSLLAFPFLVEPLVGRTAQSWAFVGCLGGWAVLVLLTARSVRQVASAAPVAEQAEPFPWGRAAAWLGLSTIPNVLLAATTQRLSEDVAAGPLQWLIPLSLYLLTFIVSFEKPAWYRRWPWLVLLALSCFVSALAWIGRWDALSLQVALASVALFSGSMLCHGELYRLRPDTHASRFYLVISSGGVVGGLFVALVAPRLFTSFAEYPLGLGAACLAGAVVVMVDQASSTRPPLRVLQASALILTAASMAVTWDSQRNANRLVFAGRNFFGVLRVESIGAPGTEAHEYSESHGRITHGWQPQHPSRRREVAGYFSNESGVGRTIAALRARRPTLSMGVLGLGVGQLANFGRPGDVMRFYEINPLVISLARGEGGFFSILADSEASVDVVAGDARVSLEQEPPRGFDLLAVDVFTGDSIPPHLLTWEAFELYRKHLAAEGVIAVHITNRYLDLEPVLASHAERLGWSMRVVRSVDKEGAPSVWGVLAPTGEVFTTPAFQSDEVTVPGPKRIEWTDEHHSLLPLLLAR